MGGRQGEKEDRHGVSTLCHGRRRPSQITSPPFGDKHLPREVAGPGRPGRGVAAISRASRAGLWPSAARSCRLHGAADRHESGGRVDVARRDRVHGMPCGPTSRASAFGKAMIAPLRRVVGHAGDPGRARDARHVMMRPLPWGTISRRLARAEERPFRWTASMRVSARRSSGAWRRGGTTGTPRRSRALAGQIAASVTAGAGRDRPRRHRRMTTRLDPHARLT